MTSGDPLARVLAAIRGLSPAQLERVDVFVRALTEPPVCTFAGHEFGKDFAYAFNDRLRFHHQTSV